MEALVQEIQECKRVHRDQNPVARNKSYRLCLKNFTFILFHFVVIICKTIIDKEAEERRSQLGKEAQ